MTEPAPAIAKEADTIAPLANGTTNGIVKEASKLVAEAQTETAATDALPEDPKESNADQPETTNGHSEPPASPTPNHTEEKPQRIPSTGSLRRKSSSSSLLNEAAGVAFLKDALERIVSIKEITKKHPDLVKSANTAIETLKKGEMPSEAEIFEPLRLACEQPNVDAKIIALDCLSKIFTFNIFNQPIYIKYKKTKPDVKTPADMDANIETVPGSRDDDEVPLIEAVIEVIGSCFEGEGTNTKVELQVLRVLMAAIVNESMPVHGKVLLQAIRQIHNIFLLSLSPSNQSIAQATLIQVVNIVFDKCSEMALHSHSKIETEDVEDEEETTSAQPMTLQEMEATLQDNDVMQLTSDEIFGDEREQCIKDAFLIVRSMSNLAGKPIDGDAIDMKSHVMRSKLLSLFVIYFILQNHMDVLLDRSNTIARSSNDSIVLVDGIRKYICLILSRNATSQVNPVYEVTLEIFWLVISELRGEFKFEIPVFLDEIYFPVSEMRTSTPHQKRYLLEVVRRITEDPKILLELYLNYDCDTAMPNVTEELVDYLTRYALARVEATPQQKISYRESVSHRLSCYDMSTIPELNTSKLSSRAPNPEANANYPIAYALKMVSIESIVNLLKSLNSQSGTPVGPTISVTGDEVDADKVGSLPPSSPAHSNSNLSLPTSEDTASAFDTNKHKKTAMLECVKLFDYSPKKGIKALVRKGFIANDDPKSIASFLLENDTLDKGAIGEYLGEGDETNIAIMHEFIDQMDFKGKDFLDALRFFLQHFRLPGESQKIDRFMLKFAEKYVDDNPGTFANADTVYVLSYSVVMLNTDQHNAQVKNRMTVEDFIKNNKGIDDGKDLDPELLTHIYTDIQGNEIILKSEQQAALMSSEIPYSQSAGLFGGRSTAKEAYLKASKEMSSKTEQVVKALRSSSQGSNRGQFYSVVLNSENDEHVRSLFDTLWMSLLAGLTPPFKDYDDEETAKLLLTGMKLSIHLACIFGIDYARTSFIRALVQFTNINNPEDMKVKNVEAIRTLLEITENDRNRLGNSWKGIFIVLSQLERLKLLSRGVDSDQVPNLFNARLANRSSLDTVRLTNTTGFLGFGKKQSLSEQQLQHYIDQRLPPGPAALLNSTEMEVAFDKVFSRSSEIEGDGIFDFIAALSEVAREEIDSSGQSDQPRMYSLQKLVDVCYYNMNRIRVQWSALWAVLNEVFNEFGCHSNPAISFFAIDSLRQLSEQFFSIEELAHFKFQKEFLQPFKHIMTNNPDVAVRDMVLDCVHYLVLKKGPMIRSGWVTLLEILTNAAADDNEQFVTKGFKYATIIAKDHFDEVCNQDGFDALVVCMAEYAKNDKFQKISLRALHEINSFVGVVSEKTKDINDEQTLTKMWFPVLFGFHDVVMEGDDLEVRSKALNYMFDALVKHGGQFSKDFWYRISEELLFPIFGILSQHWQLSTNQEDLWVWLSSTLIQALRRMIGLFTTYYSTLNGMLDGYLRLLVSCICQENETISKVGISCLEELIFDNMSKFGPEEWSNIDKTFQQLFDLTRANELFLSDPLKNKKLVKQNGESIEDEDDEEEDEEEDETMRQLQTSQKKSTIVIKCVLQLHMIQTLLELFDNDEFYKYVPLEDLMKMIGLLEDSYKFARDFNEDYNLRVRLWNSGVMDKLPNLLKQETSAVGVFISILFRLYCDNQKVDAKTHKQITETLIPLSVALMKRFVALDEKEHSRNIVSWTPVVVETLQAITEMDEADFAEASKRIYPLSLDLLDKSMAKKLREVYKEFLSRVGQVYVPGDEPDVQKPNQISDGRP